MSSVIDEPFGLEGIENLNDFLVSIVELLTVIERSSPILFRSRFRKNYRDGLEEVLEKLVDLRSSEHINYPNNYEEMTLHGLNGAQLKLKLESFEDSYLALKQEGGLENLENVLDKGSTILSSLAAAIPLFGSFAQELIDFILKEVRQRLTFWRRKK